MSLTRRLAAVLPAAGVTVLAALALSGAPAAATGDEAAAKYPAVMTTPCSEGQRDGDCTDGYAGDDTPGAAATTTAPTRGHGGYGGESPTVSPSPSRTTTSPTPSASVDTVPPGGELPATSPTPSPSKSTPGGGVSAGGTLPVTGAPMGLTMGVGALLVAAGAGAVFYTRRRRNA
ncbi:LPXTG cell wall anchor domain-containing protein [Actinoplanes sp. NPDC049681]|uniref:LPXTG cell wall anchor domain-containing protein n=1 Tax=Actinoplanes sp. NPDC049681 TaxID=3363905 RepID=UPI0037AA014F